MQAEMMPTLCPNAYAQPISFQTTTDHSRRIDELDADFSFDCAEPSSSPIPADQIFHNGVIKPIYHHHHQQQQQRRPDAEHDELDSKTTSFDKTKPLRTPFTEETRNYSSEELVNQSNTSLSELDSDTYCVWEPKTTTAIEKESNSWSKMWKLRDLLTRNVSVKETKNATKISNENDERDDDDDDNEKKKTTQQRPPQQGRKKEGGGSVRRSSYLPYRQELVGIFGSARHP